MRFGPFGNKDDKMARRSQQLSLQTIESADWHKTKNRRLEYLSEAKLKVLYDDLGWSYPTRSKNSIRTFLHIKVPVFSGGFEKGSDTDFAPSLSMLAAKATQESQRVNLVKAYSCCQPGEYVLVRFPLFAGTMTVKCNAFEKFSNAFWWQGRYRDLTLYISGNAKNLMDDVNREVCAKPTWNPSATDAALQLFGAISDVYDTGAEDVSQVIASWSLRDSPCDVLSNLNDGTRRGRWEEQAGWRDVLLRCDQIERGKWRTRIYGSPVWMTRPSSIGNDVGYGWYCVGEGRSGEKYYGEWLGGWTGVCGKMKPFSRIKATVSRSVLSDLPIVGEEYTMVEYPSADAFKFWVNDAKELIGHQDMPSKMPERVSLDHLQATWLTEKWLEKVVHKHRIFPTSPPLASV